MKYSDYSGNFITRICYTLFSQEARNDIDRNNVPSLFRCCLRFIRQIIRFTLLPDFEEPEAASVVFFAETNNQKRALQPIWSHIKDTDYKLWIDGITFSKTKITFWSLVSIFRFLKTYFSVLNEEDKIVVRFYSYWFMNAYGVYKVVDEYLRKHKNEIKVIVMSNDFNSMNVCLIENCKKHRIKSLYVQHASVVEGYSPQNVFDYSFLDGVDDYRKYFKNQQPSGLVFLSGGSRYDNESPIVQERNCIGIAATGGDNLDKVIDLCSYLLQNNVTGMVFRPHPRMVLNEQFRTKLQEMGIAVSYPANEDSLDFLSKLRLLIASESSIHTEAAITQTPSVIYNFSNLEFDDYYAFLSRGISIYYKEFDKILLECREPHPVSNTAVRNINASTGTKWQGKVSLIIAEFISALVNDGNVNSFGDSIFTYNSDGYYEYKI